MDYNSDIQQTIESMHSQSQENDENHGTNNSGNIIYTSNNYDSLRNFQPRIKYDSEEDNNYNSIRGENYTSGISNVFN